MAYLIKTFIVKATRHWITVCLLQLLLLWWNILSNMSAVHAELLLDLVKAPIDNVFNWLIKDER